MQFKPLTQDEIRYVYEHFMMQDFPDDERKPLQMILDAIDDGRYCCYGLFQDDAIAAYALLAFVNGAYGREYLLDYLAVRADLRDQGLGSLLLQKLTAELDRFACISAGAASPSICATDLRIPATPPGYSAWTMCCSRSAVKASRRKAHPPSMTG